jgi:hypothetical protein
MTNGEIIEQLENTIGLIKQDGKDWLDDRDIPILEACIKALTALDKIRVEITKLYKYYPYPIISPYQTTFYAMLMEDDVLQIIDKYRAEGSDKE